MGCVWGGAMKRISGSTSCCYLFSHAPVSSLLLVCFCAVAAEAKPAKNRVVFDAAEIRSSNLPKADQQTLVDTIVSLHQAWLNLDKKTYLSHLTADVTCLSQRTGKVQHGLQAVADRLQSEWEELERPAGFIDMHLTLRQAELAAEGDTATALYWVQQRGGSRWVFEGLGLVFQAFVKQQGTWKLTYQTDIGNLDFDVARQKPGPDILQYDAVYPVANLERAVAFYTPTLGEPEVVGDNRATFNLDGPRFHLDATGLKGLAPVRKGLPNGYVIFYVDDLKAGLMRLRAARATLLTETQAQGTDEYVVAEDPAGNVFVLMQRNFLAAGEANPPDPVIQDEQKTPAEAMSLVKRLLSAWLRMDSAAITRMTGPEGTWIDDARLKNQGVARGPEAVAQQLAATWAKYDRSEAGLLAAVDVRSLSVKPLAKQAIISYQMRLKGTGAHPFSESAMVTHVVENLGRDASVARTFLAAGGPMNGMARSLDYSAYPAGRLRESERFYSSILEDNEPYKDEQYRGYWTDNSVFGIYTARLKRDGIPVPRQANGYVSLWVSSAQQTYDYLKKQGSTFPLIKAINTKVGVDVRPGYTQIYATDSEGNGILFTEYPGN
jgi:catechol 2,3-dioxygenase-like lactoylglutathione lyase family enzyme/ketosteroid isomerase-like protein